MRVFMCVISKITVLFFSSPGFSQFVHLLLVRVCGQDNVFFASLHLAADNFYPRMARQDYYPVIACVCMCKNCTCVYVHTNVCVYIYI